MGSIEERSRDLYVTDEYIKRNPSLHEEDSLWKVSKIVPLVDICIEYINKDTINLLDVGGGAGLILSALSSHIRTKHGIGVNKFALDLSPGMLQIQKDMNPDLVRVLNEDICGTSLHNKEIDLTLMVDILEHVPDPVAALEEAKRISRYVILKVPLEDNLTFGVSNLIHRGKIKKQHIENLGHINFYDLAKLERQLRSHLGSILKLNFTNVSEYYLRSPRYRQKMSLKGLFLSRIAAGVYKHSPRLCSLLFTDFVVILVGCREVGEQ